MARAQLTIDLGALKRNWKALDAKSSGETAAVVKADGYGLGAEQVGPALASVGARSFFVALAEEGAALRRSLGPGPDIFILSGHMAGDTDTLREAGLVPVLNSVDQILRHAEKLAGHGFAVQLDTGMNRLGLEPDEWQAVRDIVLDLKPRLVMSHLACADEPDRSMNAHQRAVFDDMTSGIDARRSLAATGGILLGPSYHYDLTRPGIGLYGGLPFAEADPVVALDIPVIQIRDVAPGETVGYGNAWKAKKQTRVATVSAGYADGILRLMGPLARLWAGDTACPMVGRISMDLICIDVTNLAHVPECVSLLGPNQTVDGVADVAQTIGYEILTSLGRRYHRSYVG